VASEIERFVAAMPKVELHVHLEGAIRPATLLRLAERRRIDLPATTEEGLRQWFRFRDFDHFLQIYLLCSRCLRDPEDFQLLVEDFVAEQARQSIRYTEAHFTISTHIANGANAGEIADAMAESIRGAEKRYGARLRLIPDIVRNVDPVRADQTIEWALENRDRGVVALGISGKESHSSEPFREHFQAALAEDLHRVAHAGEQAGPESVRATLAICEPERLGHGVRAIEDAALVHELCEKRIPLEVCPTSNLRLGIFNRPEEHPLERLHRAGILLSLNSDDPALFGTTLEAEYAQAVEVLGLSIEELCGVALDGVRHTFRESEEKDDLERQFRSEYELLFEEVFGRVLVIQPLRGSDESLSERMDF
jgi:adenosine deaminase